MTRDMDLVRQILLNLEPLNAHFDKGVTLKVGEGPLAIEEFTNEQIAYHLRIMTEGGLLMREAFGVDGITTRFFGLTWTGHEFVDIVRDSKTWATVKEAGKSTGGAGLEFMKDVALAYLRSKVTEYLGF